MGVLSTTARPLANCVVAMCLLALPGLLSTATSFAVGVPAQRGRDVPRASLRGGAGATGASSTRTGAGGTAALGCFALAAAAAAGSARRRLSVPDGQQRSRTDRVVVRDGSSWGVMGTDASSSLDTSGPLPFVKLTRGKDEATVHLFGACVTSYKTDGTEWIAVRPDAKFDGSKPISGGLPFCFPQFGPGEIQQHGFARNLSWRLLEEPSDAGACVLELTDNEATKEMWPHSFRLEYRVELLEGKLSTTLKVMNTCASNFSFQCALHSYYAVSNVNTCKITGDFKGATKIDKTFDPPKMGSGDADSIEISKFTEEIYSEMLPGTVVLSDPAKGDLEIVNSAGWRDVVIWNPYGDEKMGADGFVCVESAELAQIPLGPNGVWEAKMDLVAKPKS